VAAERRADEIFAEKHLAGHLGIARLVWTKERKLAQTVRVERHDYKKKEKTAALGKRRRLQV
jgi:hypothetical protein